ncbi:hypothetical protein [Rhodococcoides fascians]|uniref:hypothetical protein n=1 Tax=Rhodococcoides fascians TaxID=1828 RepID=UPI000560DF41|nr:MULTISPECIES: hypothetical protein [Rhodococcus]
MLNEWVEADGRRQSIIETPQLPFDGEHQGEFRWPAFQSRVGLHWDWGDTGVALSTGVHLRTVFGGGLEEDAVVIVGQQFDDAFDLVPTAADVAVP